MTPGLAQLLSQLPSRDTHVLTTWFLSSASLLVIASVTPDWQFSALRSIA